MAQDGKISREELYEHVFQPRGTAFDLEEIRNREAKPERELDDIIIELLMQNETTEPEEELTEKTKELIKEATPLCRETKAYQRSYCKMRGKRSSSKELYMEMLLKMAMAPTRFHTMAKRFVGNGTDYNKALIEGGEVGVAAGFQVSLSNNVPNTTGTKYKIIAGTNRAASFAEQILKTEAYRPEKRFSDAVKGLHVYGAKVTQGKALSVLTANRK